LSGSPPQMASELSWRPVLASSGLIWISPEAVSAHA
jgi:hypothetical protein